VIQRKSPLNVDLTKFEFFSGSPVSTQQANTNTTTDMETGTVSLVPVQAGEEYAAFPLQTSGGDLAISGCTGRCSAQSDRRYSRSASDRVMVIPLRGSGLGEFR
jgi:hypothetical protein